MSVNAKWIGINKKDTFQGTNLKNSHDETLIVHCIIRPYNKSGFSSQILPIRLEPNLRGDFQSEFKSKGIDLRVLGRPALSQNLK